MKFNKIDNPEPITLNGVEIIPDESYDVDVNKDGPFITPESDSGNSIMGGDTGIDADYNIDISGADFYVPTITVIEDGENMCLEMMVNELAGEKMVEMTYPTDRVGTPLGVFKE